MIRVVNPSTGELVSTHSADSSASIEQKLDRAVDAQLAWSRLPISERGAILRSLAAGLRASSEQLARLASIEMGKPIREARAEVEKCAWTCDVISGLAPEALADEPVVGAGDRAWTTYEPLGVILAIMPWNFPYWQVVRAAVPALMSGNTVVLKHASNVSGCARALAEEFSKAGFPAGALEVVVVEDERVPEVTAQLIADDRIAAVTVTGSERAGMAVAAAAGTAIKKSVLELGGSDPFIVLENADLDAAVRGAVNSRLLNNGQSCLSAKRFIVHERLVADFTAALAESVTELRVGDPLDEQTNLGPLARIDLLATLEHQVEDSLAVGARVVVRGGRMDAPGAWYSPTIVDHVPTTSRVFAEETFGPVAAIVAFASDQEAVELAAATRFGLGASVWDADVDRALRVGLALRTGALFVNAVVASDPRHPFGGVRRSGYGRELGTAGVREFTNARTVVVMDPR
jgi:succinate-semialdehyde dehydrogenase/glutarate-semialdehyde dehydrogenase